MSISLNPVTAAKLDAFERRRRQMVLTRGACAALVSYLVLMTVVAALDWLWLLSGTTRWMLSLSAYLGTGLAVWFTCARLLVRIPNRKELARFVELARPELREQLLSAIELSADAPNRIYDSPVFRQLLQEQVGRQMETLEVASLLPLRLLSRWLIASVAVVVVLAVLLGIPGLPFRQLMARAMLPGANLERVSRIQIAILEPTPHSLTLPRDETAAVVVEVSGGEVDEVTLETFAPSGEARRQAMREHGPGQFAANIAVEEASIDYRVLAGDAITKRHTIRSRPRPHVVAFHKTYRPPAYSGLAETTATDEDGNLVALEGTVAKVVFEVDQAVSQAELRLERNDRDEIDTVALEPAGTGRYAAELPIEEPGVYRVHLVAEETGFDNPFSRKYEIRPEPDLAPRVGFVGADEMTLLLPPSDILDLKGLAEDDLPLVALEQQISVNGGDWKSVPLPIEEKTRVTVDWQWDMLDLKLKSGDQLSTKLVATDRKGNQGESVPLQIVISSVDFDPDRHAVMETKARLYDRFAELAATVEQHAGSAQEIVARLREDPAVREIPEADRSVLLDLTHKVRDEAERVAAATVEALPKMPAGVDADELELAARVIQRIEHDFMRSAEKYLDLPAGLEPRASRNEDLKRVAEAFQRSAASSRRLSDGFRSLLTHNILRAVVADLDAVSKHQARMPQPGPSLTWQRLVRHETVAVTQLRHIEQLIHKNLPRVTDRSQFGLSRLAAQLGDLRTRLEAAMESEDQLPRLQSTAVQLPRQLLSHERIATSDSNLPKSLVAVREQLDELGGSLHEPIAGLAESTSLVAGAAQKLAESGDSVEANSLQAHLERHIELSKRHVGDGSDRLADRRRHAQARIDGDPQYAADAGLTRRALAALMVRFADEGAAASEVPGILTRIAPAYRILEAGHEVACLDRALGLLLALERWNSQRIEARLDHPRQWDAICSALDRAVKSLVAAGYPQEVVEAVGSLRASQPVRETAMKLVSRRYENGEHVSAAYDLAELKRMLEAPRAEIEPIMAEARAIIAQHVPTLPELARQAADAVRELEEQTDAAADALADMSPDEAAQRTDEVEQQQKDVNRQLEDLLDALAEDAARQDLLTEEGRERARDADDSRQMIAEPAGQMNRAMDRAAAAEETGERAMELSKAADQQERTADALDKIAEHYERAEAGGDLTERRAALRQAERDMGTARQMDQQYAEAERLGEMAGKDPRQLLAELEAELRKNPDMQHALSEIGEDALNQARNSLERSAAREAEMERSLERSDREFSQKKEALAKALQELGRKAHDLANQRIRQADSAAARGNDQETRKHLAAARTTSYTKMGRARSANSGVSVEDMMEIARQTAAGAEEVAKNLKAAEETAKKAADEDIFLGNEQRRAEQQQQWEKQQKQSHEQMLREARQQLQRREQELKRAEQQVEQKQQELERTRESIKRQREKLRRSIGGQPTQNKPNEYERNAQDYLDQAKANAQQAEEQKKRAEKAVENLEKKKLEPLEAANPAAELAKRMAGEAAEIAEQLAEEAKRLAQQPDWADDLAPEANALQAGGQQQEEIGTDVRQAGEDVARAGRHEGRLAKGQVAERLATLAEDIGEVARGEVAQSRRELGEAEAEAGQEERAEPGNQQALEAHRSIGVAEAAIREQAEALGRLLGRPGQPQPMPGNQPDGSPEADGDDSPPGGQSSPEEAARGQMLARTLDEIDRSLSSGAPASPANSGSPGGQPSALSPLAQAAQSQAAQMAQGRMQMSLSSGQKRGKGGGTESGMGAPLVDWGGTGEDLDAVTRFGEDWGQLRSKSAEDATSANRQGISEQYRQQVETYFRVIAERARSDGN